MALPKRLYVVRAKLNGRWRESKPHEKLRAALEEFDFEDGEEFSYRIYEGGNAVECEWVGAKSYRERR